MQTKDHLALGQFLLKQFDCKELQRHKYSFLLGCVEPDYNMITYTRGMKKRRKFYGHNAENSLVYISRCLFELQTEGLQTMRDYFSLGIMLHYIADAFTWPHNQFWKSNLREHIIYEAKLHEVFSRELTSENMKVTNTDVALMQSFFEDSHAMYQAADHGIITDCKYIISVCEFMLAGCLHYVTESDKGKNGIKEVNGYEDTYHHGLV